MKRYGLGIAAGIIALKLAGCATFQKQYSVSELRVDPGATRTYVGQENEAIRRMMDQAVSSPDEDAWMHVQEPNGKSYFVDIGKVAGEQTREFTGSNNEVVHSFVQKNIEHDRRVLWDTIFGLPAGSKVRFYHIHPVGESSVDYTFPSENDFLGDLQMRIVCRKEKTDIEILPSRAVCGTGYSEFHSTEKTLGIDRIEEPDKKSMEDLSWTIGIRHIDSQIKAIKNPGEDPEDLSAQLTENGLKTEYRMLRDIPVNLKSKSGEGN